MEDPCGFRGTTHRCQDRSNSRADKELFSSKEFMQIMSDRKMAFSDFHYSIKQNYGNIYGGIALPYGITFCKAHYVCGKQATKFIRCEQSKL
jgi:hypothetical protein